MKEGDHWPFHKSDRAVLTSFDVFHGLFRSSFIQPLFLRLGLFNIVLSSIYFIKTIGNSRRRTFFVFSIWKDKTTRLESSLSMFIKKSIWKELSHLIWIKSRFLDVKLLWLMSKKEADRIKWEFYWIIWWNGSSERWLALQKK